MPTTIVCIFVFMRWFGMIFSLCFLIFFSSCSEKEELKKWKVNYRVYTQTNDFVEYRVRYTIQSGGTKSVGPISGFSWISEDLEEFEDDSPVRFEVEMISGKGEFILQILRDGAVHEEGIKPESSNSFELESIL